MSILPNKNTSVISDVEENWFAMVAMLLKFTTIISPLVSFAIGVLHLGEGDYKDRVQGSCTNGQSIQVIRGC
jgi:hypothetical protein